jgi:hypothetical protein
MRFQTQNCHGAIRVRRKQMSAVEGERDGLHLAGKPDVVLADPVLQVWHDEG